MTYSRPKYPFYSVERLEPYFDNSLDARIYALKSGKYSDNIYYHNFDYENFEEYTINMGPVRV